MVLLQLIVPKVKLWFMGQGEVEGKEKDGEEQVTC